MKMTQEQVRQGICSVLTDARPQDKGGRATFKTATQAANAARAAACKARKRAAAAGVEVPAGLEAKKGGTRLRDNGQAETTSTRKGGKR